MESPSGLFYCIGRFWPQRNGGKIIPAELAAPPASIGALLRERREVIAVDAGANEMWWRCREWIFPQQLQDIGRSLEQTFQQAHEPGVLLVIAKRREPHLPIQTRLMRLNPDRPALDVARLVAKFVCQPGIAVIRAFDNNPRPCGGLHPK